MSSPIHVLQPIDSFVSSAINTMGALEDCPYTSGVALYVCVHSGRASLDTRYFRIAASCSDRDFRVPLSSAVYGAVSCVLAVTLTDSGVLGSLSRLLFDGTRYYSPPQHIGLVELDTTYAELFLESQWSYKDLDAYQDRTHSLWLAANVKHEES